MMTMWWLPSPSSKDNKGPRYFETRILGTVCVLVFVWVWLFRYINYMNDLGLQINFFFHFDGL